MAPSSSVSPSAPHHPADCRGHAGCGPPSGSAPVAVPGSRCARRCGLAPCRPLPLAHLASSATGSARLAPHLRIMLCLGLGVFVAGAVKFAGRRPLRRHTPVTAGNRHTIPPTSAGFWQEPPFPSVFAHTIAAAHYVPPWRILWNSTGPVSGPTQRTFRRWGKPRCAPGPDAS